MIVSDLALLEALPGKLASLASMRAEVGVLEDTAPRNRALTEADLAKARVGTNESLSVGDTVASEQSNAEIGARHEFGSVGGKLPRRSFLKDPLLIAGQEAIAEGGVGEAVAGLILDEETLDAVFEKLALSAEAAIDGAFETGGYGTWEPLKPSTVAQKGHSTILVETEQLRDSVTHRVTSARK